MNDCFICLTDLDMWGGGGIFRVGVNLAFLQLCMCSLPWGANMVLHTPRETSI